MNTFRLALVAGFALSLSVGGCRSAREAELGCRTNDDCAALDPNTPYCFDHACVACLADANCGAGFSCADGACEAIMGWCASDRDCAEGMSCVNNACAAAVASVSDEEVAMCLDRFLSTVYFDFDQAMVSDESREKLADEIGCFDGFDGTVVLEGHADARGTSEYNLALGERRARSVRDHLRHFTAIDIRTVSYGEERPVDGGQSEAAFARNRRVEADVQ